MSINPIDSALNIFNQFRADGIILYRGFENNEEEVNLSQLNIPVISYGGPEPGIMQNVNIDRKKAIFDAVCYLKELGHREIAYIGSLGMSDINQKKLEGFKEGLAYNGISLKPEQIVDTVGYGWLEGYLATQKLLRSSVHSTAIISGAYDITIGMIRAIREENLRIPDDISIISYDNIPEMTMLDIPITAVGAPTEKIADSILESLFANR